MTIQTVSISGRFTAYQVLPAHMPAPAIILIQEIFGINPFMHQMAHWLATAGYVTIAPDLFWRVQPGIQLDDLNPVDRARAFELYSAFNENTAIEDLSTTLAWVRSSPNCDGRVGCVGFCLGGKLAYLMASRCPVDCSVSYYGVGIEHSLNEAALIQTPLLLHIAEQDQFVPAIAQENIYLTLSHHSQVTLHTYHGANHAFARPGGASYNAEATDRANSRTLAFLKAHLRGTGSE